MKEYNTIEFRVGLSVAWAIAGILNLLNLSEYISLVLMCVCLALWFMAKDN